mgnify:CR=1 FL=1
MKQKHLPLIGLKAELRRRKITYAMLAEELNISVSAVFQKINGRSDFYIYEIDTICQKFNIDYRFFL